LGFPLFTFSSFSLWFGRCFFGGTFPVPQESQATFGLVFSGFSLFFLVGDFSPEVGGGLLLGGVDFFLVGFFSGGGVPFEKGFFKFPFGVEEGFVVFFSEGFDEFLFESLEFSGGFGPVGCGGHAWVISIPLWDFLIWKVFPCILSRVFYFLRFPARNPWMNMALAARSGFGNFPPDAMYRAHASEGHRFPWGILGLVQLVHVVWRMGPPASGLMVMVAVLPLPEASMMVPVQGNKWDFLFVPLSAVMVFPTSFFNGCSL
jgi:hypothetical protein